MGGVMQDRKRGTLRDLRRETRSALLWPLYLGSYFSRLELSEMTGLSPASVSNVVRELLDEGILIEAGSVVSDGGRPRVLLQMNPEYGYVIGVDIGETRVEVELFDLAMKARAKAGYRLASDGSGGGGGAWVRRGPRCPARRRGADRLGSWRGADLRRVRLPGSHVERGGVGAYDR